MFKFFKSFIIKLYKVYVINIQKNILISKYCTKNLGRINTA